MGIIGVMILKTCGLFLLTLVCFRLMGYRSLGDMEPLDYVIVLGIGEIMGSPLSTPNLNLLPPVLAIIILTVLQISLSALFARNPKLGKMTEGGPIPIIRNGQLIEKNLNKNRLDRDDVMEELRIKGYRDESDVDMAFLEPSGRFSVILKNEASPITPRYIGESGSLLLVEHGEIRPEEWRRCEEEQETILNFLEKEKIERWEDIDTLLYKNGSFYLKKKKIR